MRAQLIHRESGVWLVSGDIDFNSVARLSEAGCSAIEQSEDRCQFDFSAVNSVNSVALSLLLNWRRKAQQQGIEVEFSALPAELQAIAELSDLEWLIDAPDAIG
tara:strand:+ start:1373 stop:1684 length:312 start_codon:yes stop_codon:yes gene_type:complete